MQFYRTITGKYVCLVVKLDFIYYASANEFKQQRELGLLLRDWFCNMAKFRDREFSYYCIKMQGSMERLL